MIVKDERLHDPLERIAPRVSGETVENPRCEEPRQQVVDQSNELARSPIHCESRDLSTDDLRKTVSTVLGRSIPRVVAKMHERIRSFTTRLNCVESPRNQVVSVLFDDPPEPLPKPKVTGSNPVAGIFGRGRLSATG